jgi:hypothetical protein
MGKRKFDESPEGGDTSCADFGAYHNVLLPSPPATPGVIMVTIPKFCGTGPFGSSINILPKPEVN